MTDKFDSALASAEAVTETPDDRFTQALDNALAVPGAAVILSNEQRLDHYVRRPADIFQLSAANGVAYNVAAQALDFIHFQNREERAAAVAQRILGIAHDQSISIPAAAQTERKLAALRATPPKLPWRQEAYNALERGGLQTLEAGPGMATSVVRDISRIEKENIRPVNRWWQTSLRDMDEQPALPPDLHPPILQAEYEQLDRIAKTIYEDSLREEIQPTRGGPLGYIVNTTLETLPLMAVSTIVSIPTGGAGAFLTAAMAEGESAYREALRNGATEDEAQLERLIVGTINGVIERAQVDEILTPIKGAGLRELKQAVRDKAWKKVAKEAGKIELKQVGKAINEGFEEALQQGVQIGAATIHGEKIEWGPATAQVLQAGLGGLVAGGALTHVSGTVQALMAPPAQVEQPTGPQPAPAEPMGSAPQPTAAQVAAGPAPATLEETTYEQATATTTEPVVPVEGAPPVATGEKAPAPGPSAEVAPPAGEVIGTFTTSKGSSYQVHADQTTTRNKAARTEHPGEQGPQPRSEKTYYLTEEQMNALSEIQAQDMGKRAIAEIPDGTGRIGVQYLDGKDKGKFEARTIVQPATQPTVGLYPLEIWESKTEHFGNKIVEITPFSPPVAAPGVQTVPVWGATNTGVTLADYEAIKARRAQRGKEGFLKSETGEQSPEDWADLVKMARFHFEAGARAFADWSRRMIDDLGDAIRPHLDRLWREVGPPGLTQDEAQTLGKREGTALRAEQALGRRIGYKLGERHAWEQARIKMAQIALKGQMNEQARQEAMGIVRDYLPEDKQGDYLKRILDAKTPAAVAQIARSIDEYLEAAHKRHAIRDLKATAKEIMGAYRRGEVKLGEMASDLRERVLAVLNAYDLAKLSDEKREELEAHQEFVQRIAGTVADAFADWEHLNAQGEDILLTPDSRWNDMKRLSKTPIRELDVEDIEAIEQNLKHIVEIQELRNDARESARREALHKEINDSTNTLVTPREEIREAGRFRRFTVLENATPRTLARRLCGKDTTATEGLLMNALADGLTRTNTKLKEWILAARERFAAAIERIPAGHDFVDTVAVILGGKNVTITYDDLMSLYMHTEASGNLQRLLKSKGMNAWSAKGRRIRTGRISLEELQAALAQLPNAYKDLAEIYFQFNRDFQAPAVNATSMQWQGFALATLERYWSFPRERMRIPSGPQVDMESAAEAKGRYQPRTGGTQRFQLLPFTAQFMRGLQMDAAYHGMTIPMQNARTLLGNEKWRSKVLDAGNGPVLNEIVTLLRRKEGLITEQTQAEMFGGRVLGTAGKGALSLRPSGALVQVAGTPAAWEVIEAKYFLRLAVPTPAQIRELEELSPNLWMRWQANQFDYALGNVAAQNAFQNLILQKTGFTDKFVRHYTWGDQAQVYYVWKAAQAKVAAEQGLAVGTTENQQAALPLLDRAMETQGQWDILYRSSLTSNPNLFWRGSTMFASPKTAQYNVFLRAIDDLHKGRIGLGEFSRRLSGVFMSSVLSNAIRLLFRHGVKMGAVALMERAQRGGGDHCERIETGRGQVAGERHVGFGRAAGTGTNGCFYWGDGGKNSQRRQVAT